MDTRSLRVVGIPAHWDSLYDIRLGIGSPWGQETNGDLYSHTPSWRNIRSLTSLLCRCAKICMLASYLCKISPLWVFFLRDPQFIYMSHQLRLLKYFDRYVNTTDWKVFSPLHSGQFSVILMRSRWLPSAVSVMFYDQLEFVCGALLSSVEVIYTASICSIIGWHDQWVGPVWLTSPICWWGLSPRCLVWSLFVLLIVCDVICSTVN